MPFQENINLKKKSATEVTLVIVLICSTYLNLSDSMLCEIYPFTKSKLLLINPDYCKVFRRESLDFLLQLSGSYSICIFYYTIEL